MEVALFGPRSCFDETACIESSTAISTTGVAGVLPPRINDSTNENDHNSTNFSLSAFNPPGTMLTKVAHRLNDPDADNRGAQKLVDDSKE